MENIGLQDSLLSRFDLLFVMLDSVDSDLDEVIADHVVRMHRYRNPKEQDGDILTMGDSAVDMLSTFKGTDDEKETTVYERYDPLLHGASRKKTDQILSVDFMRKYINIAKCLKPKLSAQACELISSEYSRLRSQEMVDSETARTQPVTARTLETLIRLATAHAKARMVKTVTAHDAEAAIELVQYAYFKKVLEKEKKKRRRDSDGEGASDEEEVNDTPLSPNESRATRHAKRTRIQTPVDSDDEEMATVAQPDSNDLTVRDSIRTETPQTTATPNTAETAVTATLTDDRFKVFKSGLQRLFRESRQQSLAVSEVTEFINRESGDETLSPAEINLALTRMTDDNQIMVADDFVILI